MKNQRSITVILKEEHKLVAKLLKGIAKTTENDPKKREGLYQHFRTEIKLHSKAEEAVLYPKLKKIEETREIAQEAEQEHKVVDELIDKLDAMSFGDEEWVATFKVLKENVEHHVKEEEGTMFKKMKKVFSRDDFQNLGARFSREKNELQRDTLKAA